MLAVDRRVFAAVRSLPRPRAVHAAIVWFSWLGNHGQGWVALALAWSLLARDPRVAIYGVAGVWGTLCVNAVIKRTIRRTRPDPLEAFIRRPSTYSFPSSHASMSAAAWLSLAPFAPWPVVVVLGVAAVTMATSRAYLGVHYPVDILAGFALGTALGVLVHLV